MMNEIKRSLARPGVWIAGAVLAVCLTGPFVFKFIQAKPAHGRGSGRTAANDVTIDPANPVLEGKTLKAWAVELDSFDTAVNREARAVLRGNARALKPIVASALKAQGDTVLPRVQAPTVLALLVRPSDPEFQALLDALADRDSRVRSATLIALRKHNLDPARVVYLVREMGKSPDAALRRSAAQFLGDLATSNADALEALKAMGEDPDANVRTAAKEGLVKATPTSLVFDDEQLTKAMKDLPNADAAIRRSARDRIVRIGRAAVPDLIAAMQNTKSPARDRALAAQALGHAGKNQEPEWPALVAALKDPEATVREYAAVSLALLNPEAEVFVPMCIEMFKDSSSRVRRRAAENLSRLGPKAKEAVPVLQKVAEKDGDVATRNAAVSALKKIAP